ncbi:PREDICTED: uncharacterized protein LOC108762043, partial [Trachymyrmex cornetzi]|uniref:uncharacterized protein LOC108762043 n=1 Tax=Trachymyrmex cornetzi TaxID=471704 RepID=UPI00084EE9FD
NIGPSSWIFPCERLSHGKTTSHFVTDEEHGASRQTSRELQWNLEERHRQSLSLKVHESWAKESQQPGLKIDIRHTSSNIENNGRARALIFQTQTSGSSINKASLHRKVSIISVTNIERIHCKPTLKEWETSRPDATIPTFKELIDFLSKTCQGLEAVANKLSMMRLNSDAGGTQKAKNPSTRSYNKSNLRSLTKAHQAKNCSSSLCRKCGKAHNTLLHFSQRLMKQRAMINLPRPHLIQNRKPYLNQFLRVLLDSGSQLNFITEDLANKLQLNGRALHMAISGIAEGTFDSKRQVEEFHPVSEFKIPWNIVLADPNFNVPGEVDLLLEAQVFWELICVGQIRACKAHPTLQKTKLGWVISDTSYGYNGEQASALCHLSTIDDLNKSISKFWEQNVHRNDTGRFIVKLPIDEEKIRQIGQTREIAIRRFTNLEKRLLTQTEMYYRYRKFMQEYIDLKHMQQVEDVKDEGAYYLPHHAVLKESSVTTKLRVVFDASCKGTLGSSLNDAMLVGPTIQEDLFSILVRFRTFQYAMTADITKMYRQVLVDESQRHFQRILWRNSPQDKLKTFELLTLTYGTASASFLAIRVIHKLAEDESELFPIGSRIILRDFYVDDLLTGSSTLEEALEIKKQITELLKKGGFELTKWSANHHALLEVGGPHEKKLNLTSDVNNEIRALGLLWNCESDVFKFESIGNLLPLEKPTKRSILSRIALVFDPFGVLGPSVIIAKILMQDLWSAKVDWDESVSHDLHTLWKEYECKLQVLSDIEITRKVIVHGKLQRLEVHGFSDASQRAYGACIYVRSINNNNQTAVHLLCSKSRVAPLKALSIPHLELCAALLLAQLMRKVLNCLPFCVSVDRLVYRFVLVTVL